jgi:hypothetical protein
MRHLNRILLLSSAVILAAPTLAAAQTGAASSQPSVVSQGPLLAEPSVVRRAIDFAGPYLAESGRERGTGFYPDVGGMITGAGWISAGPGYRMWFGHRAYVDASAAVSWHTYKTAQARFEIPRVASGHLALGSRLLWNDYTQVHFFGVGGEDPEVDSQYRIKTTDIVGYATYRPTTWLSIDGQLGWLDRPTLSAGAGWFDTDYPDARLVFPSVAAAAIRPPSHVHADVAGTVDTRDFPGYPTRGGVYRATWGHYSDRDLDAYSFQRYEIEAAHFLPLVRDRWVLAFHGWSAMTDVAPGQAVPFYMLPSLGGDNTLRGDRNYRYHDNDLLVVNAESRFGVFEHMDVSLFVDAGNVAAKAADLNLDKRSYGAGVRFHTRTSTLMRLDVAHGNEQGWRVMFKLNDPIRIGRIGRLNAAVPFVP